MIKRACITALITAVVSTAFQSSSMAADLSIGATGWYTAWNYKDDNPYAKVKYSPTILYGPALSAAFSQDLSMSFIFLYGEFDMEIDNGNTMWLKRFDSDFALNYRLNGFLKVFAGVKFIGFTWPDDGKHMAFGPGAGVSSVIPVADNLFILGNISALYLRGKEEGGSTNPYSEPANEYGYNASLSLAYYITAASTTISLGGRYQQINIDYINDGVYTYDSVSRFYGVTLTAVYTFSM